MERDEARLRVDDTVGGKVPSEANEWRECG